MLLYDYATMLPCYYATTLLCTLPCAHLVEHRLDRAQAEVVMVLLGELLHHEVVERVHLLREDLRGGEALRVEHDLDDERNVGRHHRHGAEQRLEVLGQLRAPGVAWSSREVQS